ncbi:hypothetical protein BV25DRAFT_1812761 [Artomyces pyxidatus]|uniref:Uncharacterized protein n=1 Tax=Artomyces pyxidatus TaxID=48021 RepID=A0ACB8SMR7_9AGAM|nr:hypothetical protein BV25DRAFT_1812761 [Artomyces pyxidatus]
MDVDPPVFTTRSGRQTQRTWRVEDVLPDGPGTEVDEAASFPYEPEPDTAPAPVTGPRRVVLLVTDRIRTIANKFGIRRFYKRRPAQEISEHFDLDAHYVPTLKAKNRESRRRPVREIIAPYPNFTSWLYSQRHWVRGARRTNEDQDDLQDLLLRKDFVNEDIRGVNFRKLDKDLANGVGTMPWDVERDGWVESSITIGVPTGHEVRGRPFTVPGFWHRSLCAEIRRTLSTDPAAHRFVYEPYLLEYSEPDSGKPAEGVYGELYNSTAFVNEDLRLQNSPREPGCDLPRAIAGLMFWSDATQVSHFGHAKVWPGYMYFGNQSKYERARPTSHAAHHVAYFPSLPDNIQDYIRTYSNDKPATDVLITHCRRELFQGGWEIMLDDEFVHAYRHGMIVDCIDGIRRRIYPRIFVYSADYPEKVLIATIRDKGRCPCPRCLITFDKIPELGSAADRDLRATNIRYDDALRRQAVEDARDLIYRDGYVVNSERVDNLLKAQSMIPTTMTTPIDNSLFIPQQNVFSSKLSDTGFDFHKTLTVDLLHEFELGVWKAVFSHLVRILEAHSTTAVHELNRRFRQVASFAGIRQFPDNVTDMRRIAARDFEDILQCIIPCFEGLLDAPHDAHISSLLYMLASWHGLAKFRLHVDTSLKILDDATTALGIRLRHFSTITCPAFDTKETEREYTARLRAQAQRAAAAGSLTSSSSLSGGRRARTLNLKTIKTHFLGDYVPSIMYTGTTDSTSTQIGEHEHRRVKARYARTNFRNANGQIVNMDIREARFRIMGHELYDDWGLDIPNHEPSSRPAPPVSALNEARPEEHSHIAVSQKDPVELREWISEHPQDPAVQTFLPTLRAHLHSRFKDGCDMALGYQTHPDQIVFKSERIYPHATARINYTTYDLQRDQDVIHPHFGRRGIIVHAPENGDSQPWSYAWVLGIYHANIYTPAASEEQRVEFLWVRWMHHDPTWTSGFAASRLERVHFANNATDSDAFGFVDPAHIIRGCHFIPAFHYGRTTSLLAPSIAREAAGDWRYYYMNRYVEGAWI